MLEGGAPPAHLFWKLYRVEQYRKPLAANLCQYEPESGHGLVPAKTDVHALTTAYSLFLINASLKPTSQGLGFFLIANIKGPFPIN